MVTGMDLLQLKYFHMVAQLQHMRKASEALHISQPSLSMMIHRLEKELGVMLFDRQGRNIVLNDYGMALFRHTSRIEKQLDILAADINKQKYISETSFTLATENSIYLNGIFRKFLIQEPEAHPRQYILDEQQIIQALLQEEIDLGFCQLTRPHAQIEQLPILQDQFLLLMPATYPLAEKNSLQFSDIAEIPLLSLSALSEDSNIAGHIFGQKKQKANVVFEGSQQMLVKLFAWEKGLTFASRQAIYLPYIYQLPFLKKESLFPFPIIGFPIEDADCNHQLSICWKKDRPLPAMAQTFREYLLHHYPKYTENPAFTQTPFVFPYLK